MTDSLLAQPVKPMLPANETERLAALYRYQVLDTPAEVAFDRIAALAARLFKTPTVLISLVDESRVWFKSSIGFGEPEICREDALCNVTLLSNEPLIVPDTRLDDRLTCNPFVAGTQATRFYAGAPLIDRDGFNLGALCLLDTVPHDPLTAEQEATLVDLAAMVVSELELRLAARQIARVDAALVEITQGVSRVTGGEFFDELVRHFAKVLGTDYVYIGLVEGTEPKMMKTIATCARGNIVENLEYRLQDTPCWEAIEQRKLCCYPCNVQALFPNAPLLKPLSVESYVAIPFYAADGSVMGLLGVMDGKPLENVQLAESLLTIFASRIATELERQQSESILTEQTRLLEAIATGQPLDECLGKLCSSIAKLSPHTRACVLLTDALRTKFPRSITPDFPPSLSQEFQDAPIDALAMGTCGTAVYGCQPVTCADIATDQSWTQSWRDLCIAHGIRACHSIPIMGIDNLPLGSLMLCFDEARLPTDWEYRLGEFGTKIASIAIEQLRSIEKLSESEERLNLAITAADMATWDADLSTGQTIWSAQHFEILGYDPATAGAPTIEMWLSCVHPEDRAAVMQARETAQRDRSLYRIEYRLVRADSGAVVWVASTGRFLDNQAGEAMRLVGVMFDITERKQAEIALVASEQRLQSIVDAIPHAVWIVGADGEARFNNQQWLNYYGMSYQAARAIGWSQIDPAELAAIQQQWQLCLQTGMPYETEFCWHLGGESKRWYLSRAKPIRDPSGQIVEWVGTNTDITHLKQVEAALQESQQLVQKIAETLPGLVYVYDVIEQRNIYMNPHSLAVLGYTPAQLQEQGSDVTPIVHPDDLASVMAYLEGFDTVQGDKVRELEYRARHKNGEWRWLLTSSTVFNRTPAGATQQIIGVSIDITDRKQVEAALQESQQFAQKVAETVPGLVYVYDLIEQRNIYMNPHSLAVLGFTPEQLNELGSDMTLVVVHPDDLASMMAYIGGFSAAQTGEVRELEYRVRTNGQWRWLLSCSTVFNRTSAGAVQQILGVSIDITDRKQAEANLEQSNARFESAMLAIRGTVYEWDLQTQIMYRSKGLFELLGVRAEDASPTNDWWRERMHPDDLERVQSEFRAAPAGIDRFESEYRIRHAAGHWVYVSDRSYFQYDLQGELLKVVGFNTDITKRKRAEEELHQTQALVQRQLMEIEAIYQTAPVGLTIFDRQLRYVRLNQRLAEINGIDIDDHIGRTLREIVPTVADEDEPILNSIFTTGEPLLNLEISGETQAQPGVARTWIQNCYPLRDETGEVAGINVVVQEITDRKNAEAAVRESEERFRTLADNMSQFAWMTDENGSIFWFNSRWFDYTGTTLAQMEGWGWQSVHHPEHVDRVVTRIRHCFETGEYWEDTFPLRGRDGTYRWFLSRALPIRDRSGRITRWFGTNTDITELQQAEAALADRNQELDSFAYTVSHDLKAPLRAISNLSVWIEEDLEDKLPPDTQAQFDLLRTRVKRMESMIDSLLLYARAGRQGATVETFDLGELLAEIIDSIAPPEGFTIEIQPPLPTLTTKRVFLSQVFANLISNAIKHHTSVTGRLDISAIEHPDYHEFIIKDDGPGIAPENHEKIFAIFQTLKVKDNSDSTGIGLAIVKKIVETEQGTIRLESSLGEGTTFYVTWPKSHG